MEMKEGEDWDLRGESGSEGDREISAQDDFQISGEGSTIVNARPRIGYLDQDVAAVAGFAPSTVLYCSVMQAHWTIANLPACSVGTTFEDASVLAVAMHIDSGGVKK